MTHWTSDNLDTSHFTDAGNPRVPADLYMRGMACTAGEDRREQRRLSGRIAAACILILAAGVALGWMIGGIRD